MRDLTPASFVTMSTLASCLIGCSASRPAPQSFQEAQQACDREYPTKIGNMRSQAACIKTAVNEFGQQEFGEDYYVAAKLADARLLLWKKADAGTISIADAQAALVAYGNEVAQSASSNSDSVGSRLHSTIRAGALYQH